MTLIFEIFSQWWFPEKIGLGILFSSYDLEFNILSSCLVCRLSMKCSWLSIHFLVPFSWVEGRSLLHQWWCSFWRDLTIWLCNWIPSVWYNFKWAYSSCGEGGPTAFAFFSESCGMVDTNYNESEGAKLQIQLLYIRYRLWIIFHLLHSPFYVRNIFIFGICINLNNLFIGQPNFGAIEIDWRASPVTLKLEVRDVNGYAITAVKIPLLELQLHSTESLTSTKGRKYRRHCTLEVNLPWIIRYRLTILFCCAITGISHSFNTP